MPARAINDPIEWQILHGRAPAEMLAVLDFNQDGELSTADITGFCEAIRPAGDMKSAGGKGARGSRSAAIDLDVDSDNDDDNGFPERDAAEDAMEVSSGETGKVVKEYGGDPDLRMLVFEITPDSTVTPVSTMLDYRPTYPDTLKLWPSATKNAVNPSTAIDSGETAQQRVWVRGDMNCDGDVTFSDVDPFILAMSNPSSYITQYLSAYPDMHARVADMGDFTNDGAIGYDDIDPFVAAINGDPTFVPLRLWAEGQEASLHAGHTVVSLAADTDNDSDYDANDAAPDEVRMFVWSDDPVGGVVPAHGAGLAVSPHSQVNLHTGDVLTTFPITGWDAVGPPVGFALYHNSRIAPDYAAWGFDLGDGWSVSYGAHVVGRNGDATVTVVGDDGSESVFTYDSGLGRYDAPAGEYDILTWDRPASEWTLTGTDTWKTVFNSSGYLIEIEDSSGNKVTVTRYGNGRLLSVAGADHGLTDPDADPPGTIDHKLNFEYDANGRLEHIWWRVDGNPYVILEWTFAYDGVFRLQKIHSCAYEDASRTEKCENTVRRFSYHSGTQHIAAIGELYDGPPTDPPSWITYLLKWKYTYDTDGKLEVAKAPKISDDDPYYYKQTIEYETTPTEGLWMTTVTDVRGNDWEYDFDAAGNVVSVTTPAVGTNNTVSYGFDDDHNVLTVTDQLNHTWTYTYGPIGNLLTAVSPLSEAAAQTWTLDWEQPEPTARPNFHRMTKLHDPGDTGTEYAVMYGYADPTDPTLVTTVTEPPDGEGSGVAVTTIEYYDSADPNAAGQVESVTDANDVTNEFEYNKYGYLLKQTDGLYVSGARLSLVPWATGPTDTNAGGGPTDGVGRSCCSSLGLNKNNVPLGFANCPLGTTGEKGERALVCACPDQEVETRTTYGGAFGDLLGELPTVWQPSYGGVFGGSHGDLDYDVAGRLTSNWASLDPTGIGSTIGSEERETEYEYDNLGRVTKVTLTTDETHRDNDLVREWSYAYPNTQPVNLIVQPTGEVKITGPDGDPQSRLQTYTFDELGQMEEVADDSMGVKYTYDDAGRLVREDYTDGVNPTGAWIERDYDDADRLTAIEHWGQGTGGNTLLMRVSYVWNADNTLDSRTEDDNTGATAHTTTVDFGYDDRQRLISEYRLVDGTTAVYDIEYEYDQLGNRTRMEDDVTDHVTLYLYDTDYDCDAEQCAVRADAGFL